MRWRVEKDGVLGWTTSIPTCVIINNIFWTPILKDIITNHVSGFIVVFSNFLKPGFIGPVTDSRRYMLPSLLHDE